MLHIDFTKADNLKWVHESQLEVVTPNQEYRVQEPLYLDTLGVFLNGQALDRNSDNGYEIISPDRFRLKIPKRDEHVLMVVYMKK